jgi:hypothetical protein
VLRGLEKLSRRPHLEAGRTFEQEWAHVYALRNGKIAAFLPVQDAAAYVVALDADRALSGLRSAEFAASCTVCTHRNYRAGV